MKGVPMKSRIAVFCLLLAVISIAAAYAADNEVVKVKKGDLRITLKPDGLFIPADPVELKFWPEAYEDALRIEEIVKNGKVVEKGDVLLRFEKEPLEDLIRSKELDLRAAKLRLEDVRTAFTMLDVEMELALAVAADKAKWAKKNRDEYIRVELPLDEDQHQHSRQRSVDSIQDQKEEIEQLGKMYSEDELTEETEEIVLRRAKRRLERTITGLDLQDRRRKYSVETQRPRRLDEMELEVRSKEHELKKVQATQKNQKQLKEIELRKTEIEAEKQATELAKLRKDLEKAVIYAPREGIVFHGKADAEEQEILKVKDSCEPYTTLLTIARAGEVRARFMVAEKDIFRVQPNMPVKVKPVALPDMELSGLLEPLYLLPEKKNQWKAIVKLEDSDPRLVPRMKCRVEIPIEVIKDVLMVPKSAVFEKEGKKICYVKRDDTHEVREVEVGKTDGANIAVHKGLEEGEEVFLKEPGKDEGKES
jgi:HlyD family secretion protein